MPIYEFHCDSCNKDFEELVPIGTESIPCPSCASKEVRRRVSICAFSSSGRMLTTASSSSCAGCTAATCSSCSIQR